MATIIETLNIEALSAAIAAAVMTALEGPLSELAIEQGNEEAPKATSKTQGPKAPKGPKVTVESHKKGRRHVKDGVLVELSCPSKLRRGQTFQLTPKGAQYKVMAAVHVTKGDKGIATVKVDHPRVEDGVLKLRLGRKLFVVR